MLTGNEFQTLGAENRKARDPKDRLWTFQVKLRYVLLCPLLLQYLCLNEVVFWFALVLWSDKFLLNVWTVSQMSLTIVVGFSFGLIAGGINNTGAVWGATDSWPTVEMQARYVEYLLSSLLELYHLFR